jgi:hypothetical protein
MNELQVRLCQIDQLVPYKKNARTHSDEQIAQIAASVQEFGWTNPILVGPDNVVIAGHARLAAARKLRLTEAHIMVLGYLTKAQRRALVIADNQLALNAGTGGRSFFPTAGIFCFSCRRAVAAASPLVRLTPKRPGTYSTRICGRGTRLLASCCSCATDR